MKKIKLSLLIILLILTNTTLAEFSDVDENHPNYNAIEFVQSQKIVDGYPDGTFKPDDEINRAEFTKIIISATIEKNEIKGYYCFDDIEDEWFAPFVCTAKIQNIINGYPDGEFKAKKEISFVESAKIIINSYEIKTEQGDPWYTPYVLKMQEMEAIPESIKNIKNNITRGEMAEMIYKIQNRNSQEKSKQEQKNSETFSNINNNIDTSNKNNFKKNYKKDPLDINPQISSYALPISSEEISNLNTFTENIPLSENTLLSLQENGFVIIKNPFNKKEEYITRPYKLLKDQETPIFITTDSLLHLYHIQFDETLRQIEEEKFYDYIWTITKILFQNSMDAYYSFPEGKAKEATKRNIAYFSIALELLKPKLEQIEKECGAGDWSCLEKQTDALFTEEEFNFYTSVIPDIVKLEVTQELELIKNEKGFSPSPIFFYNEDYSQYKPRGHYTRSEKLKNYFQTFMWYGRTSMLLKGSENIIQGETDNDDPDGLISTYDAEVQTLQAGLIASQFNNKALLNL